jgi:DNA repair protein RadA/Sms
MLAAVLEKRLGLPLAERDIHANAVGGVKVTTTAADLALAAALLSSLHDRPVPADCVFIGEVGLLGEVRPVAGLSERLEEARRLGFKSAAVPVGATDPASVAGVRIHEVRDVAQLGRKIVAG